MGTWCSSVMAMRGYGHVALNARGSPIDVTMKDVVKKGGEQVMTRESTECVLNLYV